MAIINSNLTRYMLHNVVIKGQHLFRYDADSNRWYMRFDELRIRVENEKVKTSYCFMGEEVYLAHHTVFWSDPQGRDYKLDIGYRDLNGEVEVQIDS